MPAIGDVGHPPHDGVAACRRLDEPLKHCRTPGTPVLEGCDVKGLRTAARKFRVLGFPTEFCRPHHRRNVDVCFVVSTESGLFTPTPVSIDPMSTPLQAMRQLLSEDKRFRIEAYQFIREALQYANENSEELPEADDDEMASSSSTRHVTGGQLCHACRRYALEQYGYLAPMVLDTWGIRSTSDLGDLVYNLIRIGQMRKSESDRREDFDGVFDFDTAFEPEFELAISDEA